MADFFSKMKDTINKGTTKISAKSSTMIEVNKLKGEINTAKRNKQTLINGIGESVYAMHLEGYVDVSTLNEAFVEIANYEATVADLEAQIEKINADLEEKLAEVDGLGKCACGATYKEGSKFCLQCGTPIPEKVVEPEVVDVTPMEVEPMEVEEIKSDEQQ